MIIILDSNIAFSAILNTQSIIGDLLLNSQGIFKLRIRIDKSKMG